MSVKNKTFEELLEQRDTVCRNGELVKREEYILQKLKDITKLINELTEEIKIKKED